MYGLLESVLGANGRLHPTIRGWCGHGFLTQPKMASQYVSTLWELQKLLGIRFSDTDWKARKQKAQKWTKRHGIPKFCGFRKSLATSIWYLVATTWDWFWILITGKLWHLIDWIWVTWTLIWPLVLISDNLTQHLSCPLPLSSTSLPRQSQESLF